jgi:DNA-binding NtrC family response regulator
LQILITLPDPTMIRIYRNLFAVNGYTNSVSTTDPAEALEIVRKGGVGLVLTGQMSDSAPLVKMVADIHALPEGKNMPCILLVPSKSFSKEIDAILRVKPVTPLCPPVNAAMLEQATRNSLS